MNPLLGFAVRTSVLIILMFICYYGARLIIDSFGFVWSIALLPLWLVVGFKARELAQWLTD